MFSIYCLAVMSLSAEECHSVFGVEQKFLQKRFHLGCKQALLKSEVLRTDDRECLTALYLYLVRPTARNNIAAIDLLPQRSPSRPEATRELSPRLPGSPSALLRTWACIASS